MAKVKVKGEGEEEEESRSARYLCLELMIHWGW